MAPSSPRSLSPLSILLEDEMKKDQDTPESERAEDESAALLRQRLELARLDANALRKRNGELEDKMLKVIDETDAEKAELNAVIDSLRKELSDSHALIQQLKAGVLLEEMEKKLAGRSSLFRRSKKARKEVERLRASASTPHFAASSSTLASAGNSSLVMRRPSEDTSATSRSSIVSRRPSGESIGTTSLSSRKSPCLSSISYSQSDLSHKELDNDVAGEDAERTLRREEGEMVQKQKTKKTVWMRVTARLPKIRGEFVV